MRPHATPIRRLRKDRGRRTGSEAWSWLTPCKTQNTMHTHVSSDSALAENDTTLLRSMVQKKRWLYSSSSQYLAINYSAAYLSSAAVVV